MDIVYLTVLSHLQQLSALCNCSCSNKPVLSRYRHTGYQSMLPDIDIQGIKVCFQIQIYRVSKYASRYRYTGSQSMHPDIDIQGVKVCFHIQIYRVSKYASTYRYTGCQSMLPHIDIQGVKICIQIYSAFHRIMQILNFTLKLKKGALEISNMKVNKQKVCKVTLYSLCNIFFAEII